MLFAALMLFFDQNDFFSQKAKERELEETENKILHLQNEIGRMEQELHDLNTSDWELEKYAREKYYEKRDGEDVYIIMQDTVSEENK